MAQRRMFAKTIIDSDAFLEMPATSQLLYFHLSMRADDEGFVNQPKAIMRICGAKDDDLRVLALRKFIIPFESGVVVIKHWKIHNYIQNDRFKETVYKEEKGALYIDENNAYSTTPQGFEVETMSHEFDEIPQEILSTNNPKISIVKEFAIIYGSYPCSINKSKKSSLDLYYNWLKGKHITVMGSKKLVRYNHIQIRFALDAFIKANAENSEQYIPRLPTFLGERTLCDYITASKADYEKFMLEKYGEEWQKMKFEYDRGEF